MIANDILITTLASLAETQSAIVTGERLGVDEKIVRNRMIELERIAGGRVYNRGFNKKPLTITPIGRDIISGIGVAETVDTNAGAAILGIQPNSLANMIGRNDIDFCVKQNGIWQIDKKALIEFAKTYDKKALDSKKHWKPRPGYISTEQARVRMKYAAIASVIQAVKRGEIQGEKVGKFWYIDEASVRARIAKGKIKRTRKPRRMKKTATAVKPAPKKKTFAELRREMQRKHNASLGVKA